MASKTTSLRKAGLTVLVVLSYTVFLMAVIGANPLKGETIAPMDLLLSYPGWDAAGWEGTVTHHERSDVLDARIPMWKKLKSSLRNQDSGMWDGVGAYGQPGVFNLVHSVWSPSFLLFLIFESDATGYYFAILVNLLLAALGTYLLLSLFINAPAAWFGGAVFALSGFNVAWLYWPHVTTSCWIPWLLWAVAGWFLHRKPTWTAAIAISSAMLILGGFPTVAVYGFYAAILLALVLALSRERRGLAMLPAGTVCMLSIASGFAMAALPIFGLHEMLSLLDLSYRQGVGLDFSTEWLLFFNPDLHGLPRTGKTVYTGLLATAMALAMMVPLLARKPGDSNRAALSVFAFSALFCSIIFAYGLLPAAIQSKIPGIGTSNWIRVVVISGLGIALLAALFLELLIGQLRRLRGGPARVAGFALIAAVVILQLVDQTLLFRRFNSVALESEFLPGTPSIEYVRSNLKPLQSVIADSAFMVPGTLGSYGIPEWFAHGFRSGSERATLEKIVWAPFKTPTAALFTASSIKWDSTLIDKLGIAHALVGKQDFAEDNPQAFRMQAPTEKRLAPALPANTLEQDFTLDTSQNLYAVSLLLTPHPRRRARSDLRLSLSSAQGHLLATTVVEAGVVKGDKEVIFQFDSPQPLQPGRYRLALEWVDREAKGRLSVWWSDQPSNAGDEIRINGRPVPGAMIYTMYSAQPFGEDEWLVMQHADEPGTYLLQNRHVPGGAYFVPELAEEADWSDGFVETHVIDNQHIEIDYSGSQAGFIVLPMRRYPGWTMTVDGQAADTREFLGMLPAVHVSGPASLRYGYRPSWLGKGIVITVAGVLALFAQFFLLHTRTHLAFVPAPTHHR